MVSNENGPQRCSIDLSGITRRIARICGWEGTKIKNVGEKLDSMSISTWNVIWITKRSVSRRYGFQGSF